MKKIFYLLLLPAFAFTFPGEKKTTIKGNMKLIKPVEWVYLNYHTPAGWVRDSAQIKDGKFKFEESLKDPVIADLWIYTEKNNKRVRETVSLFLEPGNITVTIKDSLKAMKVSGSKAHQEYIKLNELLKPFDAGYAALIKKFATYRTAKDEEGTKRTSAEWQALGEEINEKVYTPYIQNNPRSPIAIYIVTKYVGTWYEISPERIAGAEKLFASVSPELKQWPSAKDLGRRLVAAKNTNPGAMAMDFTLKDSLGRDVSLSSFRGKYVLIDFWASWCVPCRANNPNLVKAYHAFKDKGFTILGVAFDGGAKLEKAWREAMVTDGLPWVNVNDVTYPDDASVGTRYNVGSVPQNVLVDPSGKIIAKNIEGENLSEKLAELFKKIIAQSGKPEN